MKENAKISNAVIKRLPRYRRYLRELQKKGVDKISSNEFSSLIGYTASQIRQDLKNFGGFGQQGYGYNVNGLYTEISAILGLDKEYKMIVIGAGNLGQAIANYTYYYKAGFVVSGIFEINPRLIGMRINDIQVFDYENLVDFVELNNIDIGIICTTKDNAQEVADRLSFAGVKGIWNFAPVDLEVPSHIALENVHISDSLHSLAYHINKSQHAKEEQENK
ncbi:MAG: redox-sensing transcriptional repressor Rex [Clostridia bacterium]|nr:redox-sensing transcriptional repressor Rex [Clostridia bacterium]